MAVKAGVSESEGGQVETQKGQLAHTDRSIQEEEHTQGIRIEQLAHTGATNYSQAMLEIFRH